VAAVADFATFLGRSAIFFFEAFAASFASSTRGVSFLAAFFGRV
jgi:hypothetical protein